MEDNQVLLHENTRMREALRKISEHQAEIQRLLEEIDDLLRVNEQTENTPVTDEDVKQLLKKYSRLL
ncbi:MAG: hypothetical protein IJV48_07750 [Ruminococcus sp.]|nr:hypothetical protein [Ruminococcus sp.]